MDNPPEHFDITILGTGLQESILASALSKAGKKVLHLDENAYYGSDSASLTFEELVEWAKKRQAPSSPEDSIYMKGQHRLFSSISFCYGSDGDEAELWKESRQYSISLMPSLIPSKGPMIESLVGSGVSRYGGFKLLEGVGIYSAGGQVKRVPSSKEDVFKDKDMGILDKRKLMKFLMFVTSEFEESDTLKDKEGVPLPEFLKEIFQLSPTISDAIAYSIAYCVTTNEPTLPSLLRARRYLRSAGRYGSSPFLLGHYGGAGEISQGFCRSAAVHGATYILGRSINYSAQKTIKANTPDHNTAQFSFSMEGFLNPLTSDSLVTSSAYVPNSSDQTQNTVQKITFIARCVAVVDAPISFTNANQQSDGSEDTPMDTTVVVFPPKTLNDGGSSDAKNPVFVLVTGDGTMCCPRGKYICYLSTVVQCNGGMEPPSPETILSPHLIALLESSAVHPNQTRQAKPLFSIYYLQSLGDNSDVEETAGILMAANVDPAQNGISEVADEAAREAEKLFWKISGDSIEWFWPPPEPDAGSQDEDEW